MTHAAKQLILADHRVEPKTGVRGNLMCSWVQQKNDEMSIVACNGWQDVLDELEKPSSRYTVRQATSILKALAQKYHKRVKENTELAGSKVVPLAVREEICETLCRGAVKEIKCKAA